MAPHSAKDFIPEEDLIDLTNEDDSLIASASERRQQETEAINIDEDDDDEQDEDLKAAIALSLQDQQFLQVSPLLESDHVSQASALQNGAVNGDETRPSTHGASPFLGLDRKQMEAERLARLKRKREKTDVDEDLGQRHAPMTERTRDISPPPLRRSGMTKPADSLSPALTTKPIPSSISAQTQHSSDTSGLYPTGIVLQTRVAGYPETAQNISFATLISPISNLQSTLLSSFIWDYDWLFPHFETRRTNFLLVVQAKYPSERAQIQNDFEGVPNVRLCFPSMEGQVNCMHSKLMLLFYEGEGTWEKRCRIVVPTANLIGMDWGVGRMMENTLWLIDLPGLSNTLVDNTNSKFKSRSRSEVFETDFKESLYAFLRAQTIPEDVLHKLNGYDFGKTSNIGFVHSIGGSHADSEKTLDGQSTNTEWRSTGLCGLGKTVTSLGLSTLGPIQIDFVTSSLGSLNDEFVRSMYLAATGDDGLTEYTLRTAKSLPIQITNFHRGGTSTRTIQKTAGQDWRKNFHVYFPSRDTVGTSNGGPENAGTICFSEKWWDNPKFPRDNIRDCISVRNGLLMHNKIMFVKFMHPIGAGDKEYSGWTYVGSGNLSESAWGRLVQDKLSKRPKLNCKNWECGVVVPILSKRSENQTDDFSQTTPVPMIIRGGLDYKDSNKKPWCIFG